MHQPKISIIIPVHNAGVYFEKCLTSLTNQTLAEIEIILVVDCPMDGSDRLAESFAAGDNRIKLLYNAENLHTGLSRNRGIEMARGKYIGFHDHDDYCEPAMYELLYNKAEEENLDVARCNFSSIYTVDSEEKEERYIYPNVSDKISLYEHVSNDSISCVIWNHIYRADFLKLHNIRFLDSRAICSEDSIFFIEVYNQLDKLGTVEDYLYYHVFHSSNTGKVYNYRSIKNRVAFFQKLYSFLKENEVGEEQCLSLLSNNIARSLYTGSRQALLSLPLSKAVSEIRYIRTNELVTSSIRHLYKKENRAVLFQLKPSIIVFFFALKLFFRK